VPTAPAAPAPAQTTAAAGAAAAAAPAQTTAAAGAAAATPQAQGAQQQQQQQQQQQEGMQVDVPHSAPEDPSGEAMQLDPGTSSPTQPQQEAAATPLLPTSASAMDVGPAPVAAAQVCVRACVCLDLLSSTHV